jgi:hypothetical protein
MTHPHKKTCWYLLFFLLISIAPEGKAQTQQMVSYAYDYAGNRISRKIVDMGSNLFHAKKAEDPTPVEDQLGDRKITIYPNPTKGIMLLEITGANDKPLAAGGEEMHIIIYNAQGQQLMNKAVEPGTTTLDIAKYPAAYYILRVQAGDKIKEFKVIKK